MQGSVSKDTSWLEAQQKAGWYWGHLGGWFEAGPLNTANFRKKKVFSFGVARFVCSVPCFFSNCEEKILADVMIGVLGQHSRTD